MSEASVPAYQIDIGNKCRQAKETQRDQYPILFVCDLASHDQQFNIYTLKSRTENIRTFQHLRMKKASQSEHINPSRKISDHCIELVHFSRYSRARQRCLKKFKRVPNLDFLSAATLCILPPAFVTLLMHQLSAN
jgi:hypothetical protein